MTRGTDRENTTIKNSVTSIDAMLDRIDPEETIALLQELVHIRSPFFEEEDITEYVYDWLDARGLDPELHPVSEPSITGFEGNNVIARLEGTDSDAPTLILNAHMDTVQLVKAWKDNPLSGRIKDGKLYGQGACDMKGGLAAIMVAFDALATSDIALAGDVLFTAVVGEEGPYGLGANQLLRDRIVADCDAAIVTEPGPVLAQEDISNPALILGARGRFLYDIEITGEAAHGSQPYKGTNAVVDAGRLADALTTIDVKSHDQLGNGSVCPLKIEGGGEPLSVPEYCHLLVDRHVVIGETKDQIRTDAEAVVDRLDLDSTIDIGLRDVPAADVRYGPYVTDVDHTIVSALRAGVKKVTSEDPSIGYFASVGDFNHFGHRAEIPTVIIGPNGKNIHGANEFVYIDEVVDVARIVATSCVSFLRP